MIKFGCDLCGYENLGEHYFKPINEIRHFLGRGPAHNRDYLLCVKCLNGLKTVIRAYFPDTKDDKG